jgi:hypothetical protein
MGYTLAWDYGHAGASTHVHESRDFPDAGPLRDHLILAGLTNPERLTLWQTGAVTVVTPGFAPEFYTLTETEV